MPISRTEIPTSSATTLIDRLCGHWSGDFAVEREEGRGRVAFAEGVCLLYAEPDKLSIALEALDDEGLDRLEGVVARRLEALEGEEGQAIVWEN